MYLSYGLYNNLFGLIGCVKGLVYNGKFRDFIFDVYDEYVLYILKCIMNVIICIFVLKRYFKDILFFIIFIFKVYLKYFIRRCNYS